MLDGNSAAELQHDLASMRAPNPAPWLEAAREDLIERLVDGRTVHQMTRDDVFACALDEPDEVEYDRLRDLCLAALHLANVFGDDKTLAVAAVRDGARAFIERFVDAHPDWIEERAAEIAAESQELEGYAREAE